MTGKGGPEMTAVDQGQDSQSNSEDEANEMNVSWSWVSSEKIDMVGKKC